MTQDEFRDALMIQLIKREMAKLEREQAVVVVRVCAICKHVHEKGEPCR